METNKAPKKQKKQKQFDLSDKKVAPELQGVTLASFRKRLFAFGLDWLIVGLATSYFGFWVLLGIVYLISKKKFKKTLHKGNLLINKGAKTLDETLETYEIEENLRKRFINYTQKYIYGMMLVTVGFSVIVALSFLFGIFFPEDFLANIGGLKELGLIFTPVKGVEKIFQFFIGTFGGLAYFTFFTWKWNGQSPGKRIFGIRTVKLNGEKITFWNSLERVSGYVASASLLFTGFLQYFWERNHQTTHDKITETIVITDESKPLILVKKEVKKEKEALSESGFDNEIDELFKKE